MDKTLFIVRGLPGSGKTTFAKSICERVVSADDFFVDEGGNYKFEPKLLSRAHEWCKEIVSGLMEDGNRIAVANTFTQEWEMVPYFRLANKFDYRVYSVIVENRHKGENIHGVKNGTIRSMRNRFEFVL